MQSNKAAASTRNCKKALLQLSFEHSPTATEVSMRTRLFLNDIYDTGITYTSAIVASCGLTFIMSQHKLRLNKDSQLEAARC